MSINERRQVDVISQYNCHFFEVDTAQEYVEVQQPIIEDFSILRNGKGNGKFIKGDGFGLISLGIILPLGFEFYKASDDVGFLQTFNLKLVSGTGVIDIDNLFFPYENYELSMNIYYPESALTPDSFHITAIFNDSPKPQVSMLNVPSKLNGKKIYVPIWLKVEHTFPLEAII